MAKLRGPLGMTKEQVEASGNRGKRPIPEPRQGLDEPDLTDAPPGILGEEGKAEWERIKPSLVKAKRWKNRWFQLIVQYCLAWEDLVAARVIIRKEGLVLGKEEEERVMHPAFRVQKDASERMADGIKQLGLSPLQEIRMGATSPEEIKSTYDDFRRKK
jgi:P27 family predicted phage terminase small subunit